MAASKRIIKLGTRGSPLALAQANLVCELCAHAFKNFKFEIRVIKTTGDKLQRAAMAQKPVGAGDNLPLPTEKGLFTKELEEELLSGNIDMAVHSLKDLPTDLPEKLVLGAVLRRAPVQDVLIYRSQRLADTLQKQTLDWTPGTKSYRGFKKGLTISKLPQGAIIATSSTRRMKQIQHLRPDIQVVPIRGNVLTRMRKLREHSNIDATILAAAGLGRLGFHLFSDGHFTAPDAATRPELHGIMGAAISLDEMLPCVGQGAIGVETRKDDPEIEEICRAISNPNTTICVTAERAFLKAQGGGCQSPVAAYAKIIGHTLNLEAVSFRISPSKRVCLTSTLQEAEALGQRVSNALS